MQKSAYNTKQKNEILNFFKKYHNESFSARELLESDEICAGEATVYRTLAKLSQEGVLKKYTDGTTGISRYQIDSGEDGRKHMHLICNSCGRSYHLNCNFTRGLEKHIEQAQSFEVDCESTIIYGRCSDCH